MPELLAALDAFLQEHRHCGELEGGIDGERVWMACDCGAVIVQPALIGPTQNEPLFTRICTGPGVHAARKDWRRSAVAFWTLSKRYS
jgi:hypothetical protein